MTAEGLVGLDGYDRMKWSGFHKEQKSLTLVHEEYRRLNAGMCVLLCKHLHLQVKSNNDFKVCSPLLRGLALCPP